MRFLGVTTLVLGSLLPLIGASPVNRESPANRGSQSTPAKSQAIQNGYIVTLENDQDLEEHKSWLSGLVSTALASSEDPDTKLELTNTFDVGGLLGYYGLFDDALHEKIKGKKGVHKIYKNEIFKTSGVVSQDGAPWGLSRTSRNDTEKTEPDETGTYHYDERAGKDTFAYVIDSGIFTDHKEFEGRAQLGFNAAPDSEHVDAVGHGTHVAGTIASKAYGVAKKANVISVKVFAEDSGPASQIIDGIAWAVKDITDKGRQKKAVINMSLGGSFLEPINQAAEKAVKAGITVVVAAGNEGADAKNSSPASAEGVITVGAINSKNRVTSFSNHGDILNVFAPGEEILSAWIGSPDASNTIDGTSMSSPHVAGIVALLQSTGELDGPEAAAKKLDALSGKGYIKFPLLKDGPKKVANNGNPPK